MASKQPIIKQVYWVYILIHFIMLLLIISILNIFISDFAFSLGFIIYSLLMIILRSYVPKYYKKAIKSMKMKQFILAINEFENGYLFFRKYKWMDKYRVIFLMSSSQISYTESSLLNIAYCYAQLGEAKNAITSYERVLKEFPESDIAKSMLNIIYSCSFNEEKISSQSFNNE